MPDHLINMQLSKKDSKAEFSGVEEDQGPRFPHGLTLHLNNESLKKLGMTDLPTVGDKVLIAGFGVISSASENRRQRGTDRDVSIQLQELIVGPAEDTDHNSDHTAVGAVTKAIKDV